MSYYAVKNGRKIGILDSWADCKASVFGFKGAVYKKFNNLEDAKVYLDSKEYLSSERFNKEEDVYNALDNNCAIAYVDGSNKGDGSEFSWGVILLYKDSVGNNKKKVISGSSSDDRYVSYRNVAGEIFASTYAILNAIDLGITEVKVYHDYSGIRHWALGEWKTKNNLSETYNLFFKSIKDKIKVQFVKVEGHTGDSFNEEVDKVAKRALGIL